MSLPTYLREIYARQSRRLARYQPRYRITRITPEQDRRDELAELSLLRVDQVTRGGR